MLINLRRYKDLLLLVVEGSSDSLECSWIV
jgi:hypothetical protein